MHLFQMVIQVDSYLIVTVAFAIIDLPCQTYLEELNVKYR